MVRTMKVQPQTSYRTEIVVSVLIAVSVSTRSDA
jgi:hypothetical protein